MPNDIPYNKQDFIALRAIAIVGIVVGHSHLIYPYAQGHIWRIPVLFMFGGLALLNLRPLSKTLGYIVKDFYLYVAFWTAAYTMALRMLPSEITDSYLKINSITRLVTDQLFIGNSHGNELTLAAWFLIPYAAGLVLSALIFRWARGRSWPIMIAGALLLLVGFSRVEDTPPQWEQRLLGQCAAATGYMLLGYMIFSSHMILRWLSKPYVVLASAMLMMWSSTAYAEWWVSWSWMTFQEGRVVSLFLPFVALPALLWLARSLASYNAVHLLGRNSKHIMMHHVAAFAIINITLYKIGLVNIDQVHPFYVYSGGTWWPIYLVFGIMWSLIAAKVSALVLLHLRSILGKLWQTAIPSTPP